MKTAWLSAASLLILSACGKPYSIDPQLQPMVDQWNTTYPGNPVKNMNMIMGDLQAEDAVGSYNEIDQIIIDQTFWNENGADAKQQVVFHELGHAMFHYGHDFYCVDTANHSSPVLCMVRFDESLSVSDYVLIPRSIMYPWAFGEDIFYPSQLEYYLPQLNTCITCTNPMNGNINASLEAPISHGRRID